MTQSDAADYEELDDDFVSWAGPPRGTRRPKQEDVPEDEALPPEGPAGVSTTVERDGDTAPR
ncbi:hypothetical protein [Streptomyces sp. NPDC058739]|uniref:hypothetical protein n=1 Tax=Streptomyces sp. NPDC058739 TaxID=3346618 RepID=UPI0036B401E1